MQRQDSEQFVYFTYIYLFDKKKSSDHYLQKALLTPKADVTNSWTTGSAMLVYTPGIPLKSTNQRLVFRSCDLSRPIRGQYIQILTNQRPVFLYLVTFEAVAHEADQVELVTVRVVADEGRPSLSSARVLKIVTNQMLVFTCTAEAAEPTIPTLLPAISAFGFHSDEWKLSPDWSKVILKASDWLERSLTSKVLASLNLRGDWLVKSSSG